ncbi:TraV family lipoprotein [Comamonadaceae bacterium G21597-S1]|nr:TraV family lipoprotein [Comamonadaceae bacterium G21597-S1]
MTTHTDFSRAALPALTTCITAFLAGCGSMSGLDGESRYACQAPVGVACNSVSGTYANTVHATLPVQRNAPATATIRTAAPDLPAAAPPQARPPTPPASPAPRAGATATGDLTPSSEQSLRSPPRVLRLWTQAWEDRDGDLHDQAYVYLLIDSGQWRMAHIRRQGRDNRRAMLTAPAAPAALSSPSNAPTESQARTQTKQVPDKPGDPLEVRQPAATLGEPQRPAPQDLHGATTAPPPLPPQQPHYPLDPQRLRQLRDRP